MAAYLMLWISPMSSIYLAIQLDLVLDTTAPICWAQATRTDLLSLAGPPGHAQPELLSAAGPYWRHRVCGGKTFLDTPLFRHFIMRK